MLKEEITRSGKQSYEWEKKGTNLFTANSINKYPAIRQVMFRILNEIRQKDGKVFYNGREKIREGIENLNATGFYKTIFSNAIKRIDNYCDSIDQNFVIVIDENSARRELLVTAAKTMFGNDPARRMISPPFEVESHLNQNIQAADWIASVTGRLWNYQLDQNSYSEYQPYTKYFWNRLNSVSTHSTVMRRPARAPQKLKVPAISNHALGSFGLKLLEAQSKKSEN